MAAVWRYPVKSMLGETLDAAEVGPHGLRGDRAYALIDDEDGKVVTAKNPKKWPNLFARRRGRVMAAEAAAVRSS